MKSDVHSSLVSSIMATDCVLSHVGSEAKETVDDQKITATSVWGANWWQRNSWRSKNYCDVCARCELMAKEQLTIKKLLRRLCEVRTDGKGTVDDLKLLRRLCEVRTDAEGTVGNLNTYSPALWVPILLSREKHTAADVWIRFNRCNNRANFLKVLDCVWNVMAHAQIPDFLFRQNGRVYLNRRGRQFSRLLAADMCTSAVVILDIPCSEVVWRVLSIHSIRQFPPSLPFPCITVCHHISTGLYHLASIF
jgi:hypothetical protein